MEAMTDRELLELAAKAAGIELAWSFNEDQSPRERETWNVWNPLVDDGDALRLAVKLRMLIEPCANMGGDYREVSVYPRGRGDCLACEPFTGDDDAATRRAIVRAAASLSKG